MRAFPSPVSTSILHAAHGWPRLAAVRCPRSPSWPESSRCIIVAVFNTEQVEDVVEKSTVAGARRWLGQDRPVHEHLRSRPGGGARRSRVIPRGIRYLDVPVSGTSDQVRRGDGVALDRRRRLPSPTKCKDVLDALFVRRFHVGKIGDGGRAKLAVNLILGLNPPGAWPRVWFSPSGLGSIRPPFSMSRAARRRIHR